MTDLEQLKALHAQALRAADDISDRIITGGYRANLSDIETLRNHVRRLANTLPSIEGLREALTKAAERFREYERSHRKKLDALPDVVSGPQYIEAQDRHKKAERNREMAELCEAALETKS